MNELIWNKKKRTAPFINGSLLDHQWNQGKYEIRDVMEPFAAELKVIKYRRGRSSVIIMWEDITTKHQYPMSLMKFMDVVLGNHIMGIPAVFGEWRVVKNGSSFGIELIRNLKE